MQIAMLGDLSTRKSAVAEFFVLDSGCRANRAREPDFRLAYLGAAVVLGSAQSVTLLS